MVLLFMRDAVLAFGKAYKNDFHFVLPLPLPLIFASLRSVFHMATAHRTNACCYIGVS